MSLEIRAYQEVDRVGVIELWREIFQYPGTHNDPAESLRRKLAVDPGLLIVAVDEGHVVGTVMGGYDGHRGWIYSVAVATSRRREGIGSALMKAAEAALTARDCPKINLQVSASNSQVVAFYESLGWRVEERLSMGKRLV
jgi:ribosomal protein S18 acetylase RimI-like enzyme